MADTDILVGQYQNVFSRKWKENKNSDTRIFLKLKNSYFSKRMEVFKNKLRVWQLKKGRGANIVFFKCMMKGGRESLCMKVITNFGQTKSGPQ